MSRLLKKKGCILAQILALVLAIIGLFQITYNISLVSDKNEIKYNMSLLKKKRGYKYSPPKLVTYYSDIYGADKKAMVFLPVDYSEENKYPVLYLFHGLNGSYKSWKNMWADVLLQNLYYTDSISKMIVVCVDSTNGVKEKKGLREVEVAKTYDLTASDTVQCLMPYINNSFSVKTGRDNTAVAGYSMGGRNSIYAAFEYPEFFGYLGAFSTEYVVNYGESPNMLMPLLDDFVLPEGIGPFKYIMLSVGKKDKDCGNVSYEIDKYMNEQGIDHAFYEFKGGHESKVWKESLFYFVNNIFKTQS